MILDAYFPIARWLIKDLTKTHFLYETPNAVGLTLDLPYLVENLGNQEDSKVDGALMS